MIEYRHFLNTDPPLLVDIWNRQPPIRGQLQQLSMLRVEQSILSKPYFDPRGLILAVDRTPSGTVPLGFAHATVGPNEEQSDLDFSNGIIAQIKVIPGDRQDEIADGLLRCAVDYLVGVGATGIHGGAYFPFSPFYLGLYGGSEIPGVISGDVVFQQALKRNGFSIVDQISVMQRRLAGFRPVGGREQQAIRRKFQINAIADPMEQSWWECCTLGMAARERFSIYDKRNQSVCGNVSFWDMQPLAGGTGNSARGLYGLDVPVEYRRSGIATFLVGESLKYLMQQGIELVEAQMRNSEPAAVGVFTKLGFACVDTGTIFFKSL